MEDNSHDEFYTTVSHMHTNKPLIVSPRFMMKTSIVILSRTLYPQYLNVSAS